MAEVPIQDYAKQQEIEKDEARKRYEFKKKLEHLEGPGQN